MHKGPSEGSEQLRGRLSARGDWAKVRAKLGCQTGMVSRWASGSVKPSLPWRIQLQKHYGTPIEAWDIPPLIRTGTDG